MTACQVSGRSIRFINIREGDSSKIMNPEDDLEEIECIKAYDEAKASNEEPIPFDQAVAEIERKLPGP